MAKVTSIVPGHEPGRLSPLLVSVFSLLVAAAVLPPWVFGCIHSRFHLMLLATVALGGACWLPLLVTNRLRRDVSWPHLVPLLLLLAICFLQTAKLPTEILQVVSPSSVAVQSAFIPESREVSGGIEVAAPLLSAQNRISLYPAMTWEHGLWLAVLILVFVIAQTSVSRRLLPYLLVALMVNGAVLAYATIAAGIGSSFDSVAWKTTILGEQVGGFVNRNHFAFYMNICIGSGLGCWLIRYRTLQNRADIRMVHDWRLAVCSIAIVMMFASLLICQSRGGIVSALGSLLCLAIYFRKQTWDRTRVGVIAIFIVGAIALAVWVNAELHQSRIGMFLLGEEMLDVGRLTLWQRLSSLVLKFPLFGIGVGSLPYVEPWTRVLPDRHWVRYAHNDYLQILIETGVLGLAAVMAFLWRLGKSAFHITKRNDDPMRLLVSVGLLYGLLTSALHSGVDFGMRMPGCAVAVAILAGALLANGMSPRRAHRSKNENGASSQSLWTMVARGGLATGTVLAFVLAMLHFNALSSADAQFQSIVDDSNYQSEAQSTEQLAKLLKEFPYRVDWHLELSERLRELTTQSSADLSLARQHAIAARDLCPLFSYTQVELAHLAPTFESADEANAYLRRAQMAHPTSAELFLVSGHFATDRTQAIALWRKSLALSDRNLRTVMTALADESEWNPMVVSAVVPENVGRLMMASKLISSARSDSPLHGHEAKPVLLNRALKLLDDMNAGEMSANDLFLRAEVAEGLSLLERAINDYEAALTLKPNRGEWRMQFAGALVSANRLEQAREELRKVLRMSDSDDTAAIELLKSISSHSALQVDAS